MAKHPPKPAAGQLNKLWNAKVKKLVRVKYPKLSRGMKERHTLYSLLLMALVARYWNGNKKGRQGSYPWRSLQLASNDPYRDGDYLGHNIASLAVDGRGEVMDFDFNHNEMLNSSVEHAESRLIRRMFSLAQVFDGWATRNRGSLIKPVPYVTLLNETTVYTSLESCSQCSGIMALGSVKDVVFLQRDPGQSSIGNILRNLNLVGDHYLAPLPIPADAFKLPYFAALGQEFDNFCKEVASDPARPFHISPNGAMDKSPSITSFLCTDRARAIFMDAYDRFQSTDAFTLDYPEFKPSRTNGVVVAQALTNAQVIDHLHRFFDYAVTNGRRGTPHKL